MNRDEPENEFPVESLEKIDRLCWLFEQQCRLGVFPPIEQQVEGFDGESRRWALAELLRLEVHYRRQFGHESVEESLRARFPEDAELVDRAAAEAVAEDSVVARSTLLENRHEPLRETRRPDPGTAAERRSRHPSAGVSDRLHIGRFLVRKELGQGAFGQVFLAFDPQLERDVALKVPRPEVVATDALRERFRKEALAAAALDHPNIVPVYEGGQSSSLCYIASAYCPGVSLAEWLHQRTEPVPAKLAAACLVRLADAVEHAHSRGVIHRDLKPGNILLTAPDKEDSNPDDPMDLGNPRITDFGLARYETGGGDSDEGAGARTGTSAILGTPSYLSPEQALGRSRHVGPAADVYGLGAVLYELLAGRPPFVGDSALDVLEQVRSREPVAPRQLRPRVPRDLETICLKCLQKDPRARYDSAQAVREDVDRFLGGEPISARPIAAPARLARWCRRRPAIASLVAALILLTLSSLAGLSWLLAQARAHLREANANFNLARNAVDELYTAAVDDPLMQDPGMQPVKRMLLLPALRYYRELIARSEQDPSVREELATHYHRVARIEMLIGSSREALEADLMSARLREQLMQANPGAERFRVQCGESYFNLGFDYTHTGKPETGLHWYRRAVAIQQDLVDSSPGNNEYRQALVLTLVNMCATLREADEMTEAVEFTELAVAMERELVAAFPEELEFQAMLARSLHQQGLNHAAMSRHQEALDSYNEARAIQERLLDTEIGGEVSQWLGDTLNGIGAVHAWSGDPTAARETFRQLTESWEHLVDANPQVLQYQFSLGRELNNYAIQLQRTGATDEAREVSARASALLEEVVEADPSRSEFRVALIHSLHLRATMLGQIDPEQGIAVYERARTVYADLEEDWKDRDSVRRIIASLLLDLGRLHRINTNDTTAAEILQDAYVELSRGDDEAQTRYLRAFVGFELGRLHADSGRPDDADQALRTATADLVQELAREPQSVQIAGLTRMVVRTYADFLGRGGDVARQLETLDEGIAAMEVSREASAGNVYITAYLAELYEDRARVLESTDRTPEALEAWWRAVRVLEDSAGPTPDATSRSSLIRCFLRIAQLSRVTERLAEAAEAAEAASQVNPDDPQLQVRVAREYARIAEALALRDGQGAPSVAQHADRAIRSLERAVALGFDDHDALAEESDLVFLRDRPEFQQLLDQLR